MHFGLQKSFADGQRLQLRFYDDLHILINSGIHETSMIDKQVILSNGVDPDVLNLYGAVDLDGLLPVDWFVARNKLSEVTRSVNLIMFLIFFYFL